MASSLSNLSRREAALPFQGLASCHPTPQGARAEEPRLKEPCARGFSAGGLDFAILAALTLPVM